MRVYLDGAVHKPHNSAISIQARAISIASMYSSRNVRPKALITEASTPRKSTPVRKILVGKRILQRKPTTLLKQIDTSTLTRHTCNLSLPYASTTPLFHTPGIDYVLSVTLNMLNSLSGLKDSPLTRRLLLPTLCQTRRTDLLFVVFTKPTDFKARNHIRQTWASLRYFRFDGIRNHSENNIGVIDYFFTVAFSNPLNVSLQDLDLITAEIFRERDMLPVQLKGAQSNSVTLHLLASEFLLTACQHNTHHVVFIDKGLIPNVPLLGSFAVSQTPSSDQTPEPVYCFSVTDAQPIRPKKEKRLSSAEVVTLAEWPRPRYPPHCNIELGGFMISLSSLRMWRACARHYRVFKLPHVHLTGILTEAAGIPVRSYWATYGQATRLLPGLGVSSEAGRHPFFTHGDQQPTWVWRSVFRATLAEALL
ncbi:unnamed protein product [Dicrocoelium dendriticum]|nr:unnamed protein product [Dicrocoelium dendriticum]